MGHGQTTDKSLPGYLPMVATHPKEECRAQFRGALADSLGPISDVANSTIGLCRDVQSKSLELPE